MSYRSSPSFARSYFPVLDYGRLANSHAKLVRGWVWCRDCGRSERVDSAECMLSGWPKCCGQTMTIDPPEEWA